MNTKKIGLFAILPLFVLAIAPNAAAQPQVELDKVIQEGENAYDVVFKVYTGEEELKGAKLIITSDTWQREALLLDADADSVTGTNQIRIIAQDPATIKAELVMIEPEVDFPNHENWKSNLGGEYASNNPFRDDPDQADFEKKVNTFRN